MQETNIRTTSNKKYIVLAILVVIVLMIVTPVVMYRNFLNSPVSDKSEELEFRVVKDATSNIIIENLSKEGFIKNKIFAKIYVRQHKLDKNLKVGVYNFNTSMTPTQIFDKLLKGEIDPDVVTVTIPEGFNVKQIADKLYKAEIIKDVNAFLKEAQEGQFTYDFIAQIPKNRPSRLEGYLFPDTYEFKKGIKEHDVINKMLGRFEKVYKEAEINKSPELNATMDQILTMASIVEREARKKEDRPVIAGVFYNRLKTSMKLQSCATVQYILGEQKENLTYKDIEIDSPYNTYKYAGLPVGPICSPGKSAIEAALSPEKNDYLYFVAKGDGGHYFAKTYNEFLKFKASVKN